jgi:hypothetical protein
MNTITVTPGYQSFPIERAHHNIFSRFMNWTKKEEKNRIGWVGISIMAMSAGFFPITLAAILFNGANFSLIMGSVVSLALVIVTNLAALPTKYTIPAFILGIAIDIVLVVASFIY